MSVKAKSTTLFVTVFMIITLLVVGVFAFYEEEFGMSGNFYYLPDQVSATVTLAEVQNGSLTDPAKCTQFSINDTSSASEIETVLSKWQNFGLTFAENQTQMTMKITVKNDALADADNYIKVDIVVDSGALEGCTITTNCQYISTEGYIAPQETITYDIIFTKTEGSTITSVEDFAVVFNLQKTTSSQISA